MESMTQNQRKQIIRLVEDQLDKNNLSKTAAQQLIEAGNIFQTRLQSTISELTKETFSFLKEIKITVPADYTLNEYFAKFGHKPVSYKPIPGRTYKVKFWLINKGERPSSEEIIAHLKINGVLLTGDLGISLVYQEKKEELPVGKWMLSFDEKDNLYEDADGYHRVPRIYRYSGGDYEFSLGNFEDDWNGYDCLMGFCDC